MIIILNLTFCCHKLQSFSTTEYRRYDKTRDDVPYSPQSGD